MATPRRTVNVGLGLSRIPTNPVYPSQPGFVSEMNRRTRMLTDNMLAVVRGFKDVSPDVMVNALEPVFEQSKVYCPKDTYALVNSGYLEVVSFRGNPRVEIGYARGGKPDYAVYVHEMTGVKHAYPTSAKFLERAITEDWNGIRDRLGRGFSRFFHG